MKRITGRFMRVMFALGVVAALAFGAREARASTRAKMSCSDCQGFGFTQECIDCCTALDPSFTTGFCGTGGGECLCS